MSELDQGAHEPPTEASPLPAALPAGCKATAVGELMLCQRCGLQWDLADPPPPCEPMTFKRMRRRLVDEISAADSSLEIVTNLKRSGMPADPAPARRRLADLEALLRLFDRATETKELRELILGKPKQ